ncbi:hypothetical protein ACFO5Q_09805 [Kordiimonas lipolytica]|uniref:Uncharacterized protein n=1 Tax=Kordiimonas lipolytica TaxID=1662421 RepID=A0ABV8UBN2_9PROT|nr:hypothetical protein [Kordiimonas lipolytica]
MQQAIRNAVLNPIQLIFYAFHFWKPVRQFAASTQAFSYHKINTDAFLLKGAIVYFILELIALHFIVMKLAPEVLWQVFAIGVFTILYFVGMLVAWRLWPVTLSGNGLTVRTGLGNLYHIELADIESVQASAAGIDVAEDANILKLTILAQPNVLIRVKPGGLPRNGLFRKTPYDGIAFFLDDPESFRKALA